MDHLLEAEWLGCQRIGRRRTHCYYAEPVAGKFFNKMTGGNYYAEAIITLSRLLGNSLTK